MWSWKPSQCTEAECTITVEHPWHDLYTFDLTCLNTFNVGWHPQSLANQFRLHETVLAAVRAMRLAWPAWTNLAWFHAARNSCTFVTFGELASRLGRQTTRTRKKWLFTQLRHSSHFGAVHKVSGAGNWGNGKAINNVQSPSRRRF